MADALFVVARIGWSVRSHASNHTYLSIDHRDTTDVEDRRFVPIASFTARERAETRMRELELEAARLFNPFSVLGSLHMLTRTPVDDVVAALARLTSGLPADTIAHTTAQNNRVSWTEWWDEQMPTWSDETLTAVWELFDAIQFHAILEVNAE